MKIRWKIPVAGAVHNHEGGVKPGDVMDVDDESGANYCAFGYAEEVKSHHKVEEPEPEPEPEEEPEEEHAVPPKVEEHAVMKRRPGRPRKDAS